MREAPHETARDAVVFLEDGARHELVDALGNARWIDADPRAERGRGPAPLGRRKAGRKMLLDLARERGHGAGQEAPRDSRVLPHEGFAIAQQLLVRLRQHLGAEHLGGVLLALGDEARCFARRPFEKPARKTPRRKRTATVDLRALPEGKLEHERDPRTHRRTGEPLARPERHARGDRRERVGGAVVRRRRDAPPDLALLHALRQGRRDLVERDRGRLGRQPVEIVDETVGQRDPHGGHERFGIDSFERRRSLVGGRVAERHDALPPRRTPFGSIRQVGEIEQSFEKIAPRAHPSRS